MSIKESLTIEDSKPPKAKTTISTAPTTSSNNIYTDENSDYENNSYSRIPYGNEGNESEEESEEEGDLSSSRPKILSFAGYYNTNNNLFLQLFLLIIEIFVILYLVIL